MSKEAIDKSEQRMIKSIDVLKNDFATMRASRANPKVLEKISVDYYGTNVPINQVGNMSTPEPKILIITPYDVNVLPSIEKAILASDLGLNPLNDGKIIRITFPELTEERRKELVKVIKARAEEARVAIRSIRRDANDELKKEKKDGLLSEDLLKDDETSVQKVTDKYIKMIDSIFGEKEKELLNV